MKSTRFSYIIIIFLLLFIRSTESHKYHYQTTSPENQCTYTPEEISQFASSDLAANELQFHYTAKKKIKYRATTLDNNTLKSPYYSNFVKFKLCKSRLIYGIASIYQIQRHTYLHLYQLF
ncbi:hypothetical protein [Flavobacterium fluviatile]|uniref:hypothetical protein n=1 Tax=Flavobacterium fluviatile TaxID=1862387 RepID=UPI0013D11641|nr:hypothetical protein [Flavobacterium fluviatile]